MRPFWVWLHPAVTVSDTRFETVTSHTDSIWWFWRYVSGVIRTKIDKITLNALKTREPLVKGERFMRLEMRAVLTDQHGAHHGSHPWMPDKGEHNLPPNLDLLDCPQPQNSDEIGNSSRHSSQQLARATEHIAKSADQITKSADPNYQVSRPNYQVSRPKLPSQQTKLQSEQTKLQSEQTKLQSQQTKLQGR